MNELNDARLFKETDFIWVPVSLIFVYLFAYLRSRKYAHNPQQKKYFFQALNFRLLASVIYAAVIQYYYGYGDSIMYYNAVQDLHRAVSDDFGNIWNILAMEKLTPDNPLYPYFEFDGAGYTHMYMANTYNFSVAKFGLPFSLLFGKSCLAISFCFSLFAFGGCWKLYRTFVEIYPGLEKKLAIAILFLPSVIFWGSGMLKDSICLGALGFLAYGGFRLVYIGKKLLSSIAWVLFGGIILYYTKPYIMLSFLVAFTVAAVLMLNNRIPNKTLRIATRVFFIAGGIVGVSALMASFASFEISSQFSTENIINTMRGVQQGFETTQGEGSYFKLGEVDNSFTSLLLLFPAGVGTSLFRPFLWEVGNPLMVLSALEAFFFLLLTLMLIRKAGPGGLVKSALNDPVLILCIVFSILFAGFVGITTFNFGSLARYRIPCLPFYLLMLFIVGDKTGAFSRKYIISKKLF